MKIYVDMDGTLVEWKKGTPFENCKMSMLIDDRRIIESTEYFIPQTVGGASFVKMPDKVIHPVCFEEN